VLLRRLEEEFDEFMRLDAVAWRALRAGDQERTRQILLGPEWLEMTAARSMPATTPIVGPAALVGVLAGRLGLLDGDAPAAPSPAPGTVG
jgi:hypothetical protein